MLFAALTMISVGKAAAEIIVEVRRQFREVPGLYECIKKATEGLDIPESEDVLPDSDKCVAISTRSSVREMIAPGHSGERGCAAGLRQVRGDLDQEFCAGDDCTWTFRRARMCCRTPTSAWRSRPGVLCG